MRCSRQRTHGPEVCEPRQGEPRLPDTFGEMMLRYLGWSEAADAIIGAMDKTIAQKTVTYDFAGS